jgi:hypothetical protein
MTAEWSLDYECLDELHAVPSVDEHTIEQTLKRLDGQEIFYCGLTNVADRCWLTCRGDTDHHIVEYVAPPLADSSHSGLVAPRIFLLARKDPVDRHALRVRWKSNPEVFVDVRADSVLNISEVVVIFTTFFRYNAIHQDFTTIPKPQNGYLS